MIFLQGALLTIVGLLGAFSFSAGKLESWVRFAIISISVLVLAILIYQQHRNYMKGWQNARFMAESVLSNAWLFAFKIGNYDKDEKCATRAFLDSVTTIEKEVELKSFLEIYTSTLPEVADWMTEQFCQFSIQHKKSFYIENRLDDQIRWYTRKSLYNRRNSTFWFVASLILLVMGILLSILVPLYQFSVMGFISTIAAAILTWRQTKRFDELKITYAVAAKELNSLKTRFELEKDKEDIMKFVEEAEKSISREHKLWFNWTYIS